MGDGQKSVLRVGFEPRLRLAFQGAKISSDAGLLVYRELDEAAKLTASAADDLLDSRIGRNISHTVTALLRQSVYSRLAGYEDVNDADRLSIDPVKRPQRLMSCTRMVSNFASPFWTSSISWRRDLRPWMVKPLLPPSA